LRTLEAGCQAPVGALGQMGDGEIRLDAAVCAPDGVARTRQTGRISQAEAVGVAAA
ncbi:MAG: hydroxymethylbilane synthase, partial [Gammaproteobacteria bacterium]|nr:hydroxymethylbilane synthase [Gemmatimonadota bacterium]NIU73702.1 hydroxymethylbilane synthase [Gammaproteobacteria bacterium]